MAAWDCSTGRLVASTSYALLPVQLWRFLEVLKSAYNELQNGAFCDPAHLIGQRQPIMEDGVIE